MHSKQRCRARTFGRQRQFQAPACPRCRSADARSVPESATDNGCSQAVTLRRRIRPSIRRPPVPATAAMTWVSGPVPSNHRGVAMARVRKHRRPYPLQGHCIESAPRPPGSGNTFDAIQAASISTPGARVGTIHKIPLDRGVIAARDRRVFPLSPVRDWPYAPFGDAARMA